MKGNHLVDYITRLIILAITLAYNINLYAYNYNGRGLETGDGGPTPDIAMGLIGIPMMLIGYFIVTSKFVEKHTWIGVISGYLIVFGLFLSTTFIYTVFFIAIPIMATYSYFKDKIERKRFTKNECGKEEEALNKINRNPYIVLYSLPIVYLIVFLFHLYEYYEVCGYILGISTLVYLLIIYIYFHDFKSKKTIIALFFSCLLMAFSTCEYVIFEYLPYLNAISQKSTTLCKYEEYLHESKLHVFKKKVEKELPDILLPEKVDYLKNTKYGDFTDEYLPDVIFAINNAQTLGRLIKIKRDLSSKYNLNDIINKKYQELEQTVWLNEETAFLNAKSLNTFKAFEKFNHLYPYSLYHNEIQELSNTLESYLQLHAHSLAVSNNYYCDAIYLLDNEDGIHVFKPILKETFKENPPKTEYPQYIFVDDEENAKWYSDKDLKITKMTNNKEKLKKNPINFASNQFSIISPR